MSDNAYRPSHGSGPEETDREAPVRDAGGAIIARLDLDRTSRCGAPEAVFAQAKTPEETLAIAKVLFDRHGQALVTRANAETLALLRLEWPTARVSARAGALLAGTPPEPVRDGKSVVIVSAGTSDLPIAEEAELTLAAIGRTATLVTDVGVAALHRLLARLDEIRAADVVITIAGMEGALASVVAGLVSAPVIAVPTSVGYGAHLGGLSALLGMINSCAAGITVVNIDNGFGAAAAAGRILGGKVQPSFERP